jgi:hypothetical protein
MKIEGESNDAYFSKKQVQTRYYHFCYCNLSCIYKKTDFGYVVEIAIPFNQLRFSRKKEVRTLGFSFNRFYPREVCYRVCSHPIDWNRSCTLCQFHKIDGFIDMSQGRNIELDPTVIVSRTDERADFPPGEMETGKTNGEVGVQFGDSPVPDTKKDTKIILHFFDWVIRLPEVFKDRIKQVIKQVEEEFKMEYVPIWLRDEREEGVEIGEKRGIEKKAKETAKRMLEDGLPIETISKYTGLPGDIIKKLQDSNQVH